MATYILVFLFGSTVGALSMGLFCAARDFNEPDSGDSTGRGSHPD